MFDKFHKKNIFVEFVCLTNSTKRFFFPNSLFWSNAVTQRNTGDGLRFFWCDGSCSIDDTFTPENEINLDGEDVSGVGNTSHEMVSVSIKNETGSIQYGTTLPGEELAVICQRCKLSAVRECSRMSILIFLFSFCFQ